MNIFLWLLILMIIFIMGRSLFSFIGGKETRGTHKIRKSQFSLEVFYTLLIVYSIIITGFALIYFILSFHGNILIEPGYIEKTDVIGSFIHSLYFSGVTLLTIGYGDIVPIGIGRFLALVEALIGYVLPTAFMLRLVTDQIRDK